VRTKHGSRTRTSAGKGVTTVVTRKDEDKPGESEKDREGIEAVRRAGRSPKVMKALAKRREEAEKRNKDKGK
jgi:hypothetical protein